MFSFQVRGPGLMTRLGRLIMPTRILLPWIFVIGCFLGGCLISGCSRDSGEMKRPNILWITMDSFRADHLGRVAARETGRTVHTPTLDALCDESALFTQCIAQAPYTHLSVPSMITANYPFALNIRRLGVDLDSSHTTLAETLAGEGYFTYGILEKWPPGFYQGFEKLEPGNSSTLQKTEWCLQALDELDGRPFFIWLYYWDPHAPYTPPGEQMKLYEPEYELLEGFRSYGRDLRDATGHYGGAILVLGRINRGLITLSPDEREHLVNLYDGEISFVDAQIGEVFDRLRKLGLWDKTLVVLNADHGEVFGEHGEYYHGATLHDEQLRVPLIIKPPASAAAEKRIDSAVRNMDIMPTILDYCRIDLSEGLPGVSLRPWIDQTDTRDLTTFLETHNLQPPSHQVGYRDGRRKLIYDLTNGTAQLYDLIADPGENVDMLGQGQGSHLEMELQKQMLSILGAGSLADLELDEEMEEIAPETREQLRALGYIN
jgi:arylsulfatase